MSDRPVSSESDRRRQRAAIARPSRLRFSPDDRVDHCVFGGEQRPVYHSRVFRFAYDDHGYETLTPTEDAFDEVRFLAASRVKWRAVRDGTTVSSGSLDPGSPPHGFIRVSQSDPRYFETDDGLPFVPIGLNLAYPSSIPLPVGEEFHRRSTVAFYGVPEYDRWFQKLAANGGNFARLWLSNRYFALDGEFEGSVTPGGLARFDAVVESAASHGIRLKITFEHFRKVKPARLEPAEEWVNPNATFYRAVVDPDTGASPRDMDEWFSDARWQDLWLRKVRAMSERYAEDPTIAVWELWNEINACQTSRWEVQRDWTGQMLKRIAPLFPRQLVVNSLGSYDNEKKRVHHDDFAAIGMPFLQVHRYLDLGASIPVVATDPIAASIDAVQRVADTRKPVLLAETGAVNDHHTGVFAQCRRDERGIIFHDTTFAPFFAGAAGTGQNWFWDERYVDMRDLWYQFRWFADLIDGVDPRGEAFETLEINTDSARLYGLIGRSTMLLWVRNTEDTWQRVLRDQCRVEPVYGIEIPIGAPGIWRCSYYSRLWESEQRPGGPETPVVIGNANDGSGTLLVPGFAYGMVIRLSRD